MSKIIAMIPARLGSKRIKKKNLRLLAGKPLVCYAVDKCKQAKVFDDIYINSEADVFKNIADEHGIKFYKRPKHLAADDATNDMFVLDFIKNIKCDIIIQVNPTSPLITVNDIKAFVNKMIEGNYDTFHSVEEEQIEGLYEDRPLNFDQMKPMPRSQDLKPIIIFSSGIMGWKSDKYFENMKHLGSATYGGNGKTGYFTLRGFSTIDIDNEEDWQLAELAIGNIKKRGIKNIEYYQPTRFNKTYKESDVPSILKKDGVFYNDFEHENQPLANLKEIIKSKDNSKSWCHRVINTENNSATIISQLPGEGNRLHYHPNWNEWWYIIDGKWKWEIEGKVTIVSGGDIVFIKKGKLHKVTAIGDKPAIRLAISREDVVHIYPYVSR